jgi:hypothetical protein
MSDPHLNRIIDPLAFELGEAPVIDIRGSACRVREPLMSGWSRPEMSMFPGNTSAIERLSNLPFDPFLTYEVFVNLRNHLNLTLRT